MTFFKKTFTFYLVTVIIFITGFLSAENRDLIKISEDVIIKEGEEKKNTICIGGNLIINGTVQNAISLGGSVSLGSNAFVKNHVIFVASQVHQHKNAIVKGHITGLFRKDHKLTSTPFKQNILKTFFSGLKFFKLFSYLILNLLIAFIFPKSLSSCGILMKQKPVRALSYGVLAVLLTVPAVILLLITIAGIPVIPVFLSLFFLTFVCGRAAVAYCSGLYISRLLKRKTGIIASILSGTTLISLVSFIPGIGPFVFPTVSCFGIGAVIIWARQKNLKTAP